MRFRRGDRGFFARAVEVAYLAAVALVVAVAVLVVAFYAPPWAERIIAGGLVAILLLSFLRAPPPFGRSDRRDPPADGTQAAERRDRPIIGVANLLREGPVERLLDIPAAPECGAGRVEAEEGDRTPSAPTPHSSAVPAKRRDDPASSPPNAKHPR